MQYLLKEATVYTKGKLRAGERLLAQGGLIPFSLLNEADGISVFSLAGKLLTPGLVDVHVHLREPGFSYKERMATGTEAAARGGYTALCAMPNLDPAPDTVEHVKVQKALIEKDAKVRVYPYGTLTLGQRGEGELADYEALRPYVIAYSDDGRGIQTEETMREAMKRIRAIDGMVVAHCEDNALLKGGYIHDGTYAKAHGHKGIGSESEWRQVQRDLRLVQETGCRYHVCHVSAKETVALIRRAKKEGLDVSCETAPHYLLLHDGDLKEDGRFKMNPPIRDISDREALREGLADGTIDIIATDHAPHSPEEKSRGLQGSAMGIVGLECAFPVLYTGLVKPGLCSLERLLEAMTDAPRRRFRLPEVSLAPGQPADLAVFDLEAKETIDPDSFASMGRATPFEGMEAWGRCDMTMVGGEVVWQRK